MASGIVSPDGKPARVGVPAVRTAIGTLPSRRVTEESLKNPLDAFSALRGQVSDQNAIVLVGMFMLAQDIYSRHPDGSRHFQKFAEDIGLQVKNLDGGITDFMKELQTRFPVSQ